MRTLLRLKRIGGWAATIALALVLGACGAPTISPLTGSQPFDASSEGIDRAKRLWDWQGIDNYQITTTVSQWGADTTVTVAVRDGKVVAHTCAPAATDDNDSCAWADKAPQKYTIAGLFSELRSLRREAEGTEAYPEDEAINVVYDDQLGYPKQIIWNPPEYTKWTVDSFERLP